MDDGTRSLNITEKPWGVEELWASTHTYVGKFLYIKGGHRLSRKYHKTKNHSIKVLEGTLTLEAGPRFEGDLVETLLLSPGTAYYLAPRTIHRFCAPSGDVKIVEVSVAGPDDSVRLEDDYRRITDIPERGPQSDK
jgi:D-lyxose ketol-isomerase